MSLAKHFSNFADRIEPAAIRKIMAKATDPDIIAFTAGKPAPNLFPLAAIKAKSAVVIEKYGGDALQYASTQGFAPLREWVASRLPKVAAEDILIVAGSQQAIDMVSRVFVNPGDKVVIAAPTYTSALTTMRVYGPEFIEVECDEHGMLPDSLAAALHQRPKLLYCVPNFMNPTGVDMSLERRLAIARLAQEYDVPVLEDDPYGELRFEGTAKPNLYELAPEHVMYAGTFSKILVPGLRLGWLTGPPEAIFKLTYSKQAADLQASTFNQHLAFELTREGFIEAQVAHLREYYLQQRDWMMTAIGRHFPEEAKVNRPVGGMFVWAELPEQVNLTNLIDEAIRRKVVYVPGRPFFTSDRGHNAMRLSFSLNDEETIETGINRLGTLCKEAVAGSLFD